MFLVNTRDFLALYYVKHSFSTGSLSLYIVDSSKPFFRSLVSGREQQNWRLDGYCGQLDQFYSGLCGRLAALTVLQQAHRSTSKKPLRLADLQLSG